MRNLQTVIKQYAKRIVEEENKEYNYNFNESFIEQGNFESYLKQFLTDCSEAKGYNKVVEIYTNGKSKCHPDYDLYDSVEDILYNMVQKEIDKLEIK